MRRAFLIVAALATLVLVADLLTRLMGRSFGLAWVSALATLGVHGLSLVWLALSSRRVETMARVGGLPEWVSAQAEKNRRKAGVGQLAGAAMLGLGAWPGLGEWWGLVLFSASLAFQLGVFAGEIVLVNAQVRLVGHLEEWVGSLPAALLVVSHSGN